MTFFTPRPEFLTWLKEYARGRIVFDVGCGEAKLLEMMWDADIKGIGIEPEAYHLIHDYETRMRVLPFDATECHLLRETPDALVLVCRPSHTGWVFGAVHNVHETAEVLYISKPGNRHIDLPGFEVDILDAPGLVLEEVCRLRRPFVQDPLDSCYKSAGEARLIAMLRGNDFVDGWR